MGLGQLAGKYLRRFERAWARRLERHRRRRADRKCLILTVHFEDAGNGWILATIPNIPGAVSQGRTRAEARENMMDALWTVLTPDQLLAECTLDPTDEPLELPGLPELLGAPRAQVPDLAGTVAVRSVSRSSSAHAQLAQGSD